jgi:sulfite exporter TauE/SafE
MEQGILYLALAAIGLGAFHTVIGPDHYLPFVAMAQTRNWTKTKTIWVVGICGIGHVLSTIVLGAIFISVGYAADNFMFFESQRGSIASWLLFSAGLVYTTWAIVKLKTNKETSHTHLIENSDTKKTVTFWVLFTIFVFGPCESLAGLLYTASVHSVSSIIIVSGLFAIATVGVMIVMTLLMLKGINFVKMHNLEKYQHVVAGITLALCGGAIIFLGL